MKTLFIALIACLLASGSAFAQSKAEKIHALMNEAHARGIFNGNVLVAEKGTVVYENAIGFADGSQKQTLAMDLRFNIGSMAKEFDGVALMMLKEQGKLSLDDKVSDYFPELPPWSERVSIRNLIQYTSGLPAPNYPTEPLDDDVWQFLQTLEQLDFEPGTVYGYNNHNVFLRKRIVEKVSGTSFNEFVEQYMLAPLAMDSAAIDLAADAEKFAKAFNNRFIEDDYTPYMSGWVQLTAKDLYRWVEGLHSYQLISKDSLYELFTGYNGEQTPLGHSLFDGEALVYHYHHGSSYNFESSLYHNPGEQFTVLLLTNNKNFNVGSLTNAIDAILRGNEYSVPLASIYMNLRTRIFYDGYENAMQWYVDISSNEREIYDFSDELRELTKTADYLADEQRGRAAQAIKLYEYIVQQFPASATEHAKQQIEVLRHL
ncbi:beta-lactamase family protein [Pseudidiomarina sp. 1APR75-33.1]|uniref:serine hydrolase domain-containing protein n=1 Tax=Pseudidiomarina terrestris TaxID=2820060 RepID=UPI0026552BCD|nr:serine hydrolase domain-containing protein [Pseudidiomarina sp. 1APR75-33.1]MDN7128246.1 beta-lactamase family protein [Pseudidiomarina sp. 1APR75-33.1]